MTLEGWDAERDSEKGHTLVTPPNEFSKTGPRDRGTGSPVIVPPSKTMFKIHIFIGHGIRSRHRQHGPMDREKMMVVIGSALGYPDLDHIYVSRVSL